MYGQAVTCIRCVLFLCIFVLSCFPVSFGGGQLPFGYNKRHGSRLTDATRRHAPFCSPCRSSRSRLLFPRVYSLLFVSVPGHAWPHSRVIIVPGSSCHPTARLRPIPNRGGVILPQPLVEARLLLLHVRVLARVASQHLGAHLVL